MSHRKTEVRPGDEISIRWGVAEVKGTVAEVYGPSEDRRVLILLTPELSGVVSEPTTVSRHYEDVQPTKQAS